jgi:hypothetical protein
MVTQNTLREIVRLTEQAEATASKLKELKGQVAKAVLGGEAVENGSFKPVVNHIVRPSTKWKEVVARVIENHPEWAGAISAIVKSPKFTTVSEFDTVEVKATAGLTV